MEDLFNEATGNHKLVPWISWEDWNFVRDSLFSTSPLSIHYALQRISAWRSRGCVPVIIEVTASIVETQQKDSYFRDGISGSDLLAENVLTMLYCMTIMSILTETQQLKACEWYCGEDRKKNEVSIGEAADVIGIPRMLIDIRHECSHRDLPSLRLVRLASTKALDWLKAYYWEPQKMAIPYPGDRTASFGKEIKSKIRKLAFSLGVKQVTSSESPVVMRKCSKKQIKKALKNVLKLYSTFPSEVVSILLELLLKAHVSTDVADSSQLDDWKTLIIKLSNKEPDMLLSLLKAVVHMIETRAALEHESGEHVKPEHKSGYHQTEHYSYLFKWLVGNLKDLKPSRRKIITTDTLTTPKDKSLPKSTLIHLLVKCLTVSSLGNNHLASAASVLAQMAGNHTLVQKLNKLASLHTSNTDTVSELADVDPERFYNQQELSLKQESKKLELLKQKPSQKMKLKKLATGEIKKRWSMAKSWKPCPIGMLPRDVGSSGVVPVLDIVDDVEQEKKEEDANLEEKKTSGKREADTTLLVLDDTDVKKVKSCEEEDGLFFEGVKNGLMIGGLWKSVTEDEVMNMASAVRIFV